MENVEIPHGRLEDNGLQFNRDELNKLVEEVWETVQKNLGPNNIETSISWNELFDDPQVEDFNLEFFIPPTELEEWITETCGDLPPIVSTVIEVMIETKMEELEIELSGLLTESEIRDEIESEIRGPDWITSIVEDRLSQMVFDRSRLGRQEVTNV